MWGSNDRNRRGVTARAALLLAGSVIAGAMATMPAAAQQAPADADIKVPSGSLDAGLRTLSEQSGVQLIFGSDLVAGKTTSGVSGRLSIEQAVAQLLRGTGLTFRVVNGRTIQIELPPPGEEGERVLGAVRVEGTQGDNTSYIAPVRGDGIAQLGGIRGRQDQEVDGYRPRVANIGTGAQTALEDIPRSISVLTPDQIKTQDIVTLNDALRLLPGITVQEQPTDGVGGGAPLIYSRGYIIEKYQVDGGASRNLSSFGNATLNLDSYDRVELVRGPNALFSGEGSPGGTLNLIRKRPGAAESESVTLEGGSYKRINAIVDYSTPSLFGSPLAFRAVASVRRNGSEFADFDTTSTLLYGIFDAPLGDDARIEFGGQYNSLDQNGEYDGQVRYLTGDLADFGRTFNATANTGAFKKVSSFEAFAKLNVDLHKDWAFEASGYYRTTTSSFTYTNLGFNFLSATDPRYSSTFYTYNSGPGTSADLGIFSKLTGRFDTFGLKHNVYASLNYNRTDTISTASQNLLQSSRFTTIAGLLNPVYVAATQVPNSSDYGGGLSTNVGIVLGDTVSWRDIVTVTGTVRRDTGDARSVFTPRYNGSLQPLALNDSPSSGTWRPSYSATIKPFKRLTLYGSYTDGFTRQDSYFSRSGTAPNYTYAPLAPVTFRNYEVGVKYGAAKWLFTLSAYDLQRRNVATTDYSLYACPSLLGGDPTNLCYSAGGSNSRSQGIDAEFNGQIAPGLSVVASVNYNKATSAPDDPTDPVRPPLVSIAPQTAANLLLRWMPRFVAGFGIDVGARYKSRYFSSGYRQFADPTPTDPDNLGGAFFNVNQSAYVVGDLGVDYQVSKQLGLRLYVENITNKQYLSSIGTTNGNFYGAPRTFLATITWRNVGDVPADGRSPTTGLAPFGNPADWYAAFDAGYNFAGNLDAKASGKSQDGTTPVEWTFQTKNAPAYAARLGYHFLDNVRGELEVKYRRAEFGRIGGAKVAPFGVCGQTGSAYNNVPFNCDKVPGRSDNWSLMANVLYDVGSRDSIIRPFIGGGIGASRNSVDFQGKLVGIGGTAPFGYDFNRPAQETIGGASTTTSFTYQGIAGAALRLSDRINIDATYRYVAVPGMTFASYNLDQPIRNGAVLPLTPRVGTFKADYTSNMVTIGLRWSFGKR